MRIKSISITNLRCIETARLEFAPGLNLIVGVNGVGKTTVLDALRINMSRVLPTASSLRGIRRLSFAPDDIRLGAPFLDVVLTLDVNGEGFTHSRRQWLERIAKDDLENLEVLRREIRDSERLRDRQRTLLRELETPQDLEDKDYFSPSKRELSRRVNGLRVMPNCIYFATSRSVVVARRPSASKAAGGSKAAYANALAARPWNIAEFAEWIYAQEVLSAESEVAARHLRALRDAVSLFLPEYGSVRVGGEESKTLVIEHNVAELDVAWLSDGERGVLALVLDLARRLSQANPTLDAPLSEGEAIVLIDELDLHLHPKWQRQIVHKLVEVFPRCQFIATTHSPQVIGEVENDRIQIIADGQVHRPTHSYGVDSSRVLEEVMGAHPRAREVDELLSQLSDEIGRQRYDEARALLRQLKSHLGENDPEVTRAEALLGFMEGDE